MLCSVTRKAHHAPDMDHHMMRHALVQARIGYHLGEVPVGAVLALGDEIVSCAHNCVEERHDPTAHAEMLCLQQASTSLELDLYEGRKRVRLGSFCTACELEAKVLTVAGRWRVGGTLYVTLEPCAMCAGALLQGRVHRIVYGARNHLLGAHGSWVDILSPDALQRGCGQPDANDVGSAATASGWKAVSGGISHTAAPQHPFHHGLEIRAGVYEDESALLMKSFFKGRRRARHAQQRIHQCWQRCCSLV